MFVAFVTFESDDLEEERVRKVAAEARVMFEGMPNLQMKAFTLGEQGDRATNVYLWDSEDAARGFFSDELRQRVTDLYGVSPRIEFAEVVELVDNS
jgi:hypothetical protein